MRSTQRGILWGAVAALFLWGAPWALGQQPDGKAPPKERSKPAPTKAAPTKPRAPKKAGPKKPGVWKRIKKGMGKLVPKPVKRGWQSAKKKWEQARELYEAMKKFAGWDEKTLRRKRIAAAKREKLMRWKRADERAEQSVILTVRLLLWERACLRGSARACVKWSQAKPNLMQPLEQLRNLRLRRRQWKKLLPLCEKMRRIRPKSFENQLCVADAMRALQQKESALALYRKLSKKHPKYGILWLSLGQIYLADKKPKLALSACDKAIQRMPKEIQGYVCKGQAFEQQKKRKEARKAYQKGCDYGHVDSCRKVRDLRPKGITGAWVWSKMNTRINTLRVGRATRINSCRIGIKRACRMMAQIYREKARQYQLYLRTWEAEWWLRKGTQIAPYDAPAWKALSQFLLKRKRHSEGCDALQQSLRYEPRQPKLLHQLAQCHERKIKKSQLAARKAYSKACALGANRACLKINFGKTKPR